jgi:hypothetical protein
MAFAFDSTNLKITYAGSDGGISKSLFFVKKELLG